MALDLENIVAEAAAEIDSETANEAKRKIKAKLLQIRAAQKVVENLQMEYAVLVRDLGGAPVGQ